MNKKIKMIELFKLISSKKQIPKKVLYENEEYVFNGESFVCCDHDTTSLLSEYNKSRLIEFLNDEVEILEDNTEEIEELDVTKEEIDSYDDIDLIIQDRLRINELVRAVKKLKEDINKEYCCSCGVEITDENRALHNMCNECKYGLESEEKE